MSEAAESAAVGQAGLASMRDGVLAGVAVQQAMSEAVQ